MTLRRNINSYVLIWFASVLPTSSARAVQNQRAADAFCGVSLSTKAIISWIWSGDSRGTASPLQRDWIRCLIQFGHNDEKWIKYTTSVEHNFRTTSGPIIGSACRINQLTSWSNKALASRKLSDSLVYASIQNKVTRIKSTYESELSFTV
jgi:hypothetical protein